MKLKKNVSAAINLANGEESDITFDQVESVDLLLLARVFRVSGGSFDNKRSISKPQSDCMMYGYLCDEKITWTLLISPSVILKGVSFFDWLLADLTMYFPTGSSFTQDFSREEEQLILCL